MRKILIIFLANSFIVTSANASSIQNPTTSWKKIIKKTDTDATVMLVFVIYRPVRPIPIAIAKLKKS